MEKTVLFFILSVFSIPAGVLLCRLYKPSMYVLFGLMILTTYFFEGTSITFFSKEWYKTATWGFDITFVDLGCIILLISMLLRPDEYKIRLFIPLTIPFALYLFVQILSWTQLETWILNNPLKNIGWASFSGDGLQTNNFEIGLFPLFEMFKTVRFFFTLWVMTNFLISKQPLRTIVLCFGTIIIITTVTSIYQRYILGIHQVSGGMGQKHLLNVYVGMLGCYIFALAFEIKNNTRKFIHLLLFLCTIVVLILTIGRSALFGLAISTTALIALSFYKFPTKRNLFMICILGFCGLLFLSKSADSLLKRFQPQSIVASYEGRTNLNMLSVQMANKNLFGVGGGNYAAYYANNNWSNEEDPITMAHNIYYLNLGELGYFGLFAFLLIQLRIYQILITNIIKNWNNNRMIPYLIGIFAAITLLQTQDYFHFASRHNSVAFIYLILVSISSNIYLSRLSLKSPIYYRLKRLSPLTRISHTFS